MVIYLDVLIAVNFCITYFSLKGTAKLLHAGYRTSRIIAASVFGGLSSLTVLLSLEFMPSLILKTALTSIITLITFGFGRAYDFALRSVTAAVIAALVCGVTIMLREITGSNFFAAAGGYPYIDISVSHLVISTAAAYMLITLFRRISDKLKNDEMIRLLIKKDDCTAEILAYPDSGNNLFDFLTGLPVIVCRKDSIKNITPDFNTCVKGVRIIPFSTVGGTGVVTAFRADSITVCRKNGSRTQIDALIGTMETALINESFDAVINPKIIM